MSSTKGRRVAEPFTAEAILPSFVEGLVVVAEVVFLLMALVLTL